MQTIGITGNSAKQNTVYPLNYYTPEYIQD